MSTQPEALRLADVLARMEDGKKYYPSGAGGQMLGSERYQLIASGFLFWELRLASDELRRLHAENEQLRFTLDLADRYYGIEEGLSGNGCGHGFKPAYDCPNTDCDCAELHRAVQRAQGITGEETK